MRKTALLVIGAVLGWSGPALASDPTGVYAILDRVEFEPDESKPERIKLYGAFVLAQGQREYGPALQGYLYFTLPKAQAKRDNALKEWKDLKKVVGSGDFVSFGSRFNQKVKVRKAAPPPEKVEPAQIDKWVAALDSEKSTDRDAAMLGLEKAGAQAEPALKKALEGQPSADGRRRLEYLLNKLDGPPDEYPLGHGLYREKANSAFFPPNGLAALPRPVAPANGAVVAPGKITLSVQTMQVIEPKELRLVFEIQNSKGDVEKSEPLSPGDKETTWTPKMEIRAGESYTWRVKAVANDGGNKWEGPAASAELKGKASP